MFADVVAVTFHAACLSPDGAPSGRMRRRRRTAARRARRTPVRGATTVLQSDRNAFSLPSANLAPSRRLDFSVGNSFFRNPGSSPLPPPRARRLGPLFRLPELPCEGRPRPPAGSGRGQRGVDAGTPVDPGRPLRTARPCCTRGDSRADLRRPVAGRRHSRRRPGRQGAGGLRAAEGEVRGRHRGRTAQADPCVSASSAMGRCIRRRCFPPASPRR